MTREETIAMQNHIIRDIETVNRMIDIHTQSRNPLISCHANRWRNVKADLCDDYRRISKGMRL